MLPPFNFAVDVPSGLAKILYGVPLLVTAPDVLHGISEVEPHVFRDLDALDSGWV